MYLSLQGNIGLGKAIEYFTSNQMTVSVSLNDTQKYDLAVEIDGKLSRVQVKTSRNRTASGAYQILLRHCGVASGKNVCTPFDRSGCDYIFAYTADDKMYLIPSEKISSSNAINVGEKYKEYEVHSRRFSEFAMSVS